MSKADLLNVVSQETGLSVATVGTVYDSIVSHIIGAVQRGRSVMLTKFGRFYLIRKEGHAVQFTKNGEGHIDGYNVLKFSASTTLNRHLSRLSDVDGDSRDSTQ